MMPGKITINSFSFKDGELTVIFKLLLIIMLVLNILSRSPMLKQAFNSIVQNVDGSTDPRRAIKVVMKSLGERGYVAQETMHHLLSLKLHSSTFKVVPVSLNGSRRVCDTASIEDGESCTDYLLLYVYAKCH